MASLTFANVLTRVANRLRIPEANTTETTKVAAVINDVYREIASKAAWEWLYDRQIINTVDRFGTAEDSTTANVTKGSTSVTLSATQATSLLDKQFNVPGNEVEDGLYRVSAHTAGTDAVTLASAYTGTTNTTASYQVWTDEYDLATDVGEVRFVRRFGWPGMLDRVSPQEMQRLKSHDRSEGPPVVYAVWDYETSGDPTTQKQLVIHPFPDDTYQLEVHFKQSLNTEVSGSTRLLIPDDYVHVLEWGVLSIAYPVFLSDNQRGQHFGARYSDALNLMVSQHRANEGQGPQFQPADHYRRFYRSSQRRTAANSDLGNYFDRLPVSW